jgi:CDP-glucose 4,6-dehydratase
MAVNQEFWRNRRVFVTGHTGFKGSWLCLWLQQMGATVTGFALDPPTRPSLFEIAKVADGMVSRKGDVREPLAVRSALAAAEPEVVIHMAAQSLVRSSYSAPIETYATNIMGTVNVLDAIRYVSSVRAIVNVTSDKCYENLEWMWGYRETEPLGGHDPYASSKGCSELVTAAYRRSFFHAPGTAAIASARAGNVIGGGDWAADRLIPDTIRALSSGINVRIRNPAAVRPWQHVLEPLGGYLLLAERLWSDKHFEGGWNFGPADDDVRSVASIVDQLIESWGGVAQRESDIGSHPHEAHYLRLDSSKARVTLGWKPRIRLDTSLAWIVDWHKAQLAGLDMREVTLRQIAQFQA